VLGINVNISKDNANDADFFQMVNKLLIKLFDISLLYIAQKSHSQVEVMGIDPIKIAILNILFETPG